MSRTWSLRLSRCWTLTVVDVDSRRQQLLDVLPALGVAAAGNVAVGQFVDQGQRRRVGEETVEVHFLQFHPRYSRLPSGCCGTPARRDSVSAREWVSTTPARSFTPWRNWAWAACSMAKVLPTPAPRRERLSGGRARQRAGRPAARRRVRCRSWIGRTVALPRGRTIAGDHPPMRRYCKPLRGSLGKPSASTPPAPCSAPAR